MKEKLDELLNPLKDAIFSRMASPLTSSYVISWCLWNFKLLLIIFSENPVSTIFQLIDTHVFPNLTCTFINLTAPLGIALAYIYGYQIVSNKVHKYQVKMQTEHQNDLRKAAKTKLLTEEESLLIQGELITLRSSYSSELNESKKTQDRLERLVKAQSEKINELSSTSEKQPNKKVFLVSTEEKTILNIMSGESRSERESLKNQSNLDTLTFNYHLQRLIDANYVSEVEHDNSDTLSIYELTQTGRGYLISSNKRQNNL